MPIVEHLISIAIGFSLLCLIYVVTSWEFTVLVMFFWLCFSLNNNVNNQKIITTNQQNLEKLIRRYEDERNKKEKN